MVKTLIANLGKILVSAGLAAMLVTTAATLDDAPPPQDTASNTNWG